MTITGSTSARIDAAPAEVMATLTDIAALPTWNAKMTRVVEQPVALEPGADWVVEFHVMGRTWQSRSVVEELDPIAGRFSYRSRTDDGNPSEATWTWHVEPDPSGIRVTVSWSLRPVTFWRRVLLGRIRARQLAREEVPASLLALATAAAARTATPG